jgi:hypothetical protein
MTILQKLRTVMPHTINDDIHKVTFKYNFWGKDGIVHKLCNLTNFWNIYTYIYFFKSVTLVMCTEHSLTSDWLRARRLSGWS